MGRVAVTTDGDEPEIINTVSSSHAMRDDHETSMVLQFRFRRK